MSILKKLSLLVFILMILLAHIGDDLLPGSAPDSSADNALLVILDTSFSMVTPDDSGVSRIEKAKEAVDSVFTNAGREKIVGLRTFNTNTKLVISPKLRKDIHIASSLADVSVAGSTNIGRALRSAAGDVTDFTTSMGKHLPWTWILVSDGEGNAPDMDIKTAKELAAKYPHIVCHTIGIDMHKSGASELRQIASIFGGRCWIVGQGQLVETVHAAASLAGFKSSGLENKGSSSRRIFSSGMSLSVIFIFSGIAILLRKKISEGLFLLFMSMSAGALAWGGCELLLPAKGSSILSVIFIQNGAYFMIAGVAFGAVLTASEGLYLGEPRRAAEQAIAAFHVAVFGGILAGVLGQGLFLLVGMMNLSFGLLMSFVGVFARSTGWAIAGSIVGACPGAAAKSRKQINNGLLGGLIGGAIGGLLFEIITYVSSSTSWPRMVALAVTGIAIAVMIRVVENYRKEAWLIIEEGGPSGKVYIINKATTVLGSHYKCDVIVGKESGVDARPEAKIISDGKVYKIVPAEKGKVSVNGQAVASHHLSPGDMIEVAAGRLSFYCRRSEDGPSPVEEDMILPKTERGDGGGGMAFNKSDTGTPSSSNVKSPPADDGDDDCLMQFETLEVAGRKIEDSPE